MTFMIISARAKSSRLSERMLAPYPAYVSSANPLPPPAPRSIRSVWPAMHRASAPAGVKATRFSLFFISFGTPIIMAFPLRTGGL